MKYPCPHCNQPGISRLRRAFLGPALPATCSECRGKIGVPYGRTLAVQIPIVLAIFIYPLPLFLLAAPLWLYVAFPFLMIALAVVLHLKLVPLEKRYPKHKKP